MNTKTDLEALMEQDAAELANAVPSDDALAGVRDLVAGLQQWEREVLRLTADLEYAKHRVVDYSEKYIPDRLAELGLSELKLDDGTVLKVQDEYYANVPSPDSDKPELLQRRADVFQWLRTNNHADLIKNDIRVSLTKGQDALAQRTINGLTNAGIPFTQSENVHYQTLRAFVREQMENGNAAFPVSTFGAGKKRVASLKPAKKSKSRT